MIPEQITSRTVCVPTVLDTVRGKVHSHDGSLGPDGSCQREGRSRADADDGLDSLFARGSGLRLLLGGQAHVARPVVHFH
jgi:hypothetical protein